MADPMLQSIHSNLERLMQHFGIQKEEHDTAEEPVEASPKDIKEDTAEMMPSEPMPVNRRQNRMQAYTKSREKVKGEMKPK